MLITIVRDRKIPEVMEEVDDSVLLKHEETLENDDQKLEIIEYCLFGCEGEAHVSGTAHGDGSFCERHVHRSLHLIIKRMPVSAGGKAGQVG